MKKQAIIDALHADLKNWTDAPTGIALGIERAIKIIEAIPESSYPDIKIKNVYDYYCPYCRRKLAEEEKCQCMNQEEVMTGNEYQRLAMRTNDRKNTFRLLDFIYKRIDLIRYCKKTDNRNGFIRYCKKTEEGDAGSIINACMGLAGEVGELNDLFKKHIFHEKPLDLIHVKKELGDICWYIAEMCDAYGWELEEIMAINIEKLQARFPDGFDVAKANNRRKDDI